MFKKKKKVSFLGLSTLTVNVLAMGSVSVASGGQFQT